MNQTEQNEREKDVQTELFTYNHPEVDRIEYGVYKEYIRVLSKIILYLLQDGCTFRVQEVLDSVGLGPLCF